jgi:hypothetical protein
MRPRRFVTRRRLAQLNAQAWEDFRAHWPMHVLQLVQDFSAGFLAGTALGLALLVYALDGVR